MRFKHRGKLGDIVYSLAAVRAFPGSSYFIDANGIEMPPTATAAILPLLNAQPYIEEADAWRGQPIDHDLDGFRAWDPTVHNLADCHLRSMNLPFSLRDAPWIHLACARI